MKKIVICTMLLFMAASSYGQETGSEQTLSRQEYLKKSKDQKTAAVVLLGSSAVLGTAGLIVFFKNLDFDFVNGLTEKDPGISAALIAGALGASLGSIPLFAASAKNKRKAMAVTANLKFENTHFHQKAATTAYSYPSLLIKISLN